MKITVLIENTESSLCSCCEHGLSLYIETPFHKLLADAGQSTALIQNAQELGIDLSKIDSIVLSHGHYDHSGGIMAVKELAPNAKVYMQRTATGDFYHDERYIGIDKNILTLPYVQLLDGDFTIDSELSIFSGIAGRRYWAESNLVLKRHCDDEILQDEFEHEQCLVITCEGKRVLISGCAHNGILNVLDRYKEIYSSLPDIVISGFHLMKKTPYTEAEIQTIKTITYELNKMDVLFYSGHCTSEAGFEIMKEIMGDKLKKLYSGLRIM